jgi:hypothetical protein
MPDGATKRDHLLAVERVTGETPDDLKLLPIPAGMDGLWSTFLQLHPRRAPGMNGPAALTPSDLLAWQQLYGVEFTPFEVETLFALDDAAVNVLTASPPPTDSGNHHEQSADRHFGD